MAPAVGGDGVRRHRPRVGRRGGRRRRGSRTPRPPGASCSTGARLDRPADAPPGAGPVLLGAMGFTGREPAADDAWGPFGASSLVLPELAPHRHAARRVRDRVARRRRRPTTPVASTRAGRRLADRARELPAEPERDRRDAGVRAARGSARSSRPTTSGGGSSGCTPGAVGRGRIDKVVLARRVGPPVAGRARRAERAPPPRRERAREHDLRVPARRADVPRRHARAARPDRGPDVPDRRRRGHDPARRGSPPRTRELARRLLASREGPRGARDRRRRDPRPARAGRRLARRSRPSPAS